VQKKIIAIIGGPGTGKTTLINGLITNGFCCYPEISREITLEAQKKGINQLFLEQPLLFSKLLLEGRKKQYQDAFQEPSEIVFIDRGLPDVLGYLHYRNQEYPTSFVTVCKENRYSAVFILPPWEEIYVSDQARYENYEQSQAIHQHIVKTYKDFDYAPIEVPKDTVENRIKFILEVIQQES
jgi:predicted ATPase